MYQRDGEARMFGRRGLRATAAAALVGLSTAFALLPAANDAAAQTQTVAGAHQFVGIIAGQQTTRVDMDIWGQGWNRISAQRPYDECYWDDGRRHCFKTTEAVTVTRPAATLLAAKRVTDCQTGITVKEDSTAAAGGSYPAMGSIDLTVDWAKVAKVQQDGSAVSVSPTPTPIRFQLSSEDLAKRMAFAMEFIRQNCDAAAATGF